MKANHNHRILLIDHQSYWREISSEALKRADFAVSTLATYNYSPPQELAESKNPDLVVLGCSRVEAEERQLIDQVLSHKHHLLVLCTSLSWQTMRALFLQGVDDILDKPYNPKELVRIVSQALGNTSHRHKYQAIEHQAIERNGAA